MDNLLVADINDMTCIQDKAAETIQTVSTTVGAVASVIGALV